MVDIATISRLEMGRGWQSWWCISPEHNPEFAPDCHSHFILLWSNVIPQLVQVFLVNPSWCHYCLHYHYCQRVQETMVKILHDDQAYVQHHYAAWTLDLYHSLSSFLFFLPLVMDVKRKYCFLDPSFLCRAHVVVVMSEGHPQQMLR